MVSGSFVLEQQASFKILMGRVSLCHSVCPQPRWNMVPRTRDLRVLPDGVCSVKVDSF